jgi:hypothetical protein
MKVKIGKYPDYLTAYALAEKLCFWVPDVTDEYGFKSKPQWVHDFGEWLAYGSVLPEPKQGEVFVLGDDNRKPTLFYRFLMWLERKRKRKVYVKIHNYDTWNMDDTLAHIIVPMLHQLKKQKQGAPVVDNEDLPKELQLTEKLPDGQVDPDFFKRWDWVIDEMIFSFESKLNSDWQDQFYKGDVNIALKKLPDGNYEYIPNSQDSVDREGLDKYQKRIDNGFRLFGKYYESLWS